MAESSARRDFEALKRKSEKSGQRISQKEEDADFHRQLKFENDTIPKLDTQLKIVSQSYQDMVKTLLLQLTVNSDQSLQCLSFRLGWFSFCFSLDYFCLMLTSSRQNIFKFETNSLST